MSYFSRGAYTFSFDLKSGYHHDEIFEGHQTYLGFSWKHSNSNQVKFYVFYSFTFRIIVRPSHVHKFLTLLRNIGGIKAFTLLFFLTKDGVLKRILKCAVL